ncbi:MAG: hypothetical protein JG767_1324 [Deferribacteraceae bacterium]|nr:hypothetical protein [Deferribacteraceae bacterium]
MLRVLIFIFLTSSLVFAEIKVDTGCVYLDQIDKMFSHEPVYCGIKYNEDVNIYLPKVAKISGVDIKILRQKFPEKIAVKRNGVMIEEKEILEEIQKFLKETYTQYVFDIKKFNYNRKVFTDKKGNFKIKIEDIPFGSTNIYIDNGEDVYRFYAYIETYKQGYVATSRIGKGQEFKNNYTKQLVNITNIRELLADNLENKLANSTIFAGRPILKKNVYSKPDILKGERVKILYKNENISVSTSGEALEDGYIGEKLQVKNSMSDKALIAVYKGNGVAVVHF